MEYRIKLRLSVGLTHGSGFPHYSLRQLLAVLKKSTLSTASLTLAQTLGLEEGKEEDTVTVDILWPEAEVGVLQEHCARLNTFLGWVFEDLGQRWILVEYRTSRRGRSLRDDHCSLRASGPRELRIEQLIPRPPTPTLAVVVIPGLASARERTVRSIMADLARMFGGCTIRCPVPTRAAYRWDKDSVIVEQLHTLEIALPGGVRARRRFLDYVQGTLQRRLRQENIAVHFHGGGAPSEMVLVH